MSNLRELTNAELDLVSGGAEAVFKTAPTRSSGCNPVITLIEDIILILESLEGCNSGGKVAAHKVTA
jgi:hypothetical protein